MHSTDPERDSSGPIAGEAVHHGPGITSNRAFPTNRYPSHLDPFVLFERFSIDPNDGFPMHAHRGFEIVSYMLEGGMAHEDSLGVSHTATAGEAMHITAGEEIRHSEFSADGAACSGLQLWVNLPREQKKIEPNYADAAASDLPTADLEGATVTTVVGDGSPLEPTTSMAYLDAEVTDSWAWSIPDGWTGFCYGVSGSGTVDGATFGEGDVLPVTAARTVDLQTDDELRVVAVSGRPHGDPIRLRGPFVL
ncbi:pirin family protein [Natrialbaceae archaeon A-arb3/5]